MDLISPRYPHTHHDIHQTHTHTHIPRLINTNDYSPILNSPTRKQKIDPKNQFSPPDRKKRLTARKNNNKFFIFSALAIKKSINFSYKTVCTSGCFRGAFHIDMNQSKCGCERHAEDEFPRNTPLTSHLSPDIQIKFIFTHTIQQH
jgi:hypothetical protein